MPFSHVSSHLLLISSLRGIIILIFIYMEEGVRGLSDLTNVAEDLNPDLKFYFFPFQLYHKCYYGSAFLVPSKKSNTCLSPGYGWIFMPHSDTYSPHHPSCQEIIYFFPISNTFFSSPSLTEFCLFVKSFGYLPNIWHQKKTQP